jgi:hypothetical protein
MKRLTLAFSVLTEAELSRRRSEIQSEREKLVVIMEVSRDMLNQMRHALDFYEEGM